MTHRTTSATIVSSCCLLLLLIVPLGAQTAAPSQPAQPGPVIQPIQVGPGPHGGGTWRGPGDTVPPCPATGCPTPPPPPQVNCPDPCCGDFSGLGCFTCDHTDQPVTLNWLVQWPSAPECFQNQVARIHEITIGEILAACNSANAWPALSNCIPATCTLGVDAVFAYTSIPFRYWETGVPTTTPGEYLPICGMCHRLQAVSTSGSCDTISSGATVNDTFVPLGCTSQISHFSLQIDCSCFQEILDAYALLGLYNPLGGAYLTNDSVAFTVLVKCCSPTGPTCP